MQLEFIDWAMIFGFFGITLVVGFVVSKSAGKSEEDFFLGGRSMPWWLLGFSMVATTFSTDTPNLVTDLVRQNGVAGNWCWWAFLLTGMLTVFLYSRLWRRSGVLTDIEFYEIRYSGKPAAFLRGFRAIYLGVFFNMMIMAGVSLAAIKIGGVMLGLSPLESILYASVVTVIFSSMGGFKGVLITDFLLFIIAMVGAFAAAYFALDQESVKMVASDGQTVTGLKAMVSFFKDNPELSSKLALVPSFEDKGMLFSLFAIPLLFGWWSVYYPGAEPGGGGYLVQRMLAAKDEQHALGATLFFNIAHYALRPWPWIIVALCSMIVFPLSTNSEVAATISAKQAIVEIAKKAETSPTKVWDYVDELAKEKGFNKEAKVNVEVITLKSLINLEMDDAKALVSGLKVFHPLTQAEKNKFIEVLLKENTNAKNNKESLDLVTRAKTQLNFVNKGVFFLRAAFDKDRVPDDKLGHDLGYSAMLNFLPHGWLGLILTSLVAAYMSTISTHLNWGSSYVVNDFYLRFIKPEASPVELVWVGRISTVVLMIITAIFALQLQNAMQLFKILLSVGAGTGLLLILRWFWWRINALSEITALIVSFFASVVLQVLIPKYAPELSESFNNIIPNVNSGDFTFLLIVLITTISWVSVTLFTKPTDNEKLYKFCEKINPAGPGWNAVYNSAEKDGVKIVSKHEKENIPFSLLCMILGVLLVYGFLFATGYWIYDNTVPAIIASVVSLISGVLLVILWKKISADKAAPSSE